MRPSVCARRTEVGERIRPIVRLLVWPTLGSIAVVLLWLEVRAWNSAVGRRADRFVVSRALPLSRWSVRSDIPHIHSDPLKCPLDEFNDRPVRSRLSQKTQIKLVVGLASCGSLCEIHDFLITTQHPEKHDS